MSFLSVSKTILQYLKDFVVLWPTIILVVACYFFLKHFNSINNPDSYNVVLGITLGVFASFLADISKKSFDQFQQKHNLHKTAKKLLEQDAKSIYTTFEMYAGIQSSVGKSGTPPGVENLLPPLLEMKYWDHFSNQDEFLSLASDESFNKIFREFLDMEKLNNLMKSALDNTDEDKKRSAYMIALAISKQIIKDGNHKKLLRMFMSSDNFEKYESGWKTGLAR